MAEALAIARVILWGQTVGALTEDADGVITFEYEPAFAASGLEISPLLLPLSRLGPVQFPELRRVAGLRRIARRPRRCTARSLRQCRHRAVLRRPWPSRRRDEPGAEAPLHRPSCHGRPRVRAGGRPADARRRAGITRAGAPGGAGATADRGKDRRRAHGNHARGRVRRAAPGQRRSCCGIAPPIGCAPGSPQPEPGDEPWLVKFDGVGELDAPDFTARPFNRIEYAYSRLARDAGIEMPEAELLEMPDGLAHFAVRRFDRVGERRLHMHSLGGLQHVDYDTPGIFSYEQYFRTVQSIVPPAAVYASVTDAFRRAVFNIAAVNQDDHVKNFGFLMDEQGHLAALPGLRPDICPGRELHAAPPDVAERQARRLCPRRHSRGRPPPAPGARRGRHTSMKYARR